MTRVYIRSKIKSKLIKIRLDIYYSTPCRITPWLTGVMLAYSLLKMRSEKHIRIPKVNLTHLNVQFNRLQANSDFQYLNIILLAGSVSVVSMLVVFANGSNEFFYKGRLWWSLSICYMIFACLNDQGGIINWFLSHPSWQPISRLSFSIYLIHQTVMAVIFADQRIGWYFSVFTEVFIETNILSTPNSILKLIIKSTQI